MASTTLGQRLRYRFDTFMARGGVSIFLSLVISFVVLLVIIGLLRAAVHMWIDPTGAERDMDDNGGVWHQIYQTFNHLSDPGTMAYDIDSSGWYKVTAILGGMSGIVILSALIAFITTALDQKLMQLKKGHSKVIEEGHTLILGWNDRVIEILRELVIANESEDDACAVILSDRDKEFMDDFLGVHLRDPKTTRVVTRSGHVSSLVNLDIVSVQTCKSVIVLAYCEDRADDEAKEASDTRVIKTILGVMASKADGQQLNIVAELFLERSRRIAEEISPEEITTVDAHEILAKILVQTSRSVGLSLVYGEAMSFDGCEMYFYNDPRWTGRTFGQVQFHFPDGVPLGVRSGEGELRINPPVDREMAEDDDVLILAEDDSTIEYRAEAVAGPQPLKLAGGRVERHIERELIIGWNSKVPLVVREYADYVLDGSRIDILVHNPGDAVRSAIEELDRDTPGLSVALLDIDPMSSQALLEIEPFRYDNIIIVSQGGAAADPETTDSETIVILLLIRQIFEANGDTDGAVSTNLITEIMDSQNQELVARTGVHDFIISNRFVSMMLAQISEEQDIKKVYDDLFSEAGSEIYLKPASLYLEQFPADVSFADMMALAQQRDEVCIGVKLKRLEPDMQQNFGVKLIPEKTTRYQLEARDCLVVVAEDDT